MKKQNENAAIDGGSLRVQTSGQYHFAVSDEQIVIKDSKNTIVETTRLAMFAGLYTGRARISKAFSRTTLLYVVQALNHIFFTYAFKYKVSSLAEITINIIEDFFEMYAASNENKKRGNDSVRRCISAVSHFFCNLSLWSEACSIKPEDLLIKTEEKKKNGGRAVCYVPTFRIRRKKYQVRALYRDIPEKIFDMLVDCAYRYDPMIAFAIIAQATSGLRPSEALNLRQDCSIVSKKKGIQVEYCGDEVLNVRIDLSKEYVLRSDGVSVGGIKIERTVTLYKPFIPIFLAAYEKHKLLISDIKCEEYAPIFLTRSGKAMTYATYLQRLQSLINKHLIPELLESDDPVCVAHALKLQDQSLAPHAFRHYFTVALVRENLDVAQVMYFRGDASPESALAYLANKEALMRDLERAHSDVIAKLGAYIGR